MFFYIYQNSQGPCNKHSGSKYNSYEDNHVILDQKFHNNLDIFNIIYISYWIFSILYTFYTYVGNLTSVYSIYTSKHGEEEPHHTFLSPGSPILGFNLAKNSILGVARSNIEHYGRFLVSTAISAYLQ